jgi:hypothetical protein
MIRVLVWIWMMQQMHPPYQQQVDRYCAVLYWTPGLRAARAAGVTGSYRELQGVTAVSRLRPAMRRELFTSQ